MKRKELWIVLPVSAAAGAIIATVDFRKVARRFPALAPDHALTGHKGLLLAAIACWVFFGLYWEKAAKSASAAKRSESGASRGVHVFLANLALILEILPIQGLGRFLPASSLVMAAGLAIEAGGLALAIWARRHLGRHWSGEITIKVDHQLIRSGPYRRLRHPIYTGILGLYAGNAMVSGEWLALIGFTIALFAYWRKIRLEERNLRDAFGEGYEAYCRDAWALIPGVY